MAHPPFRVGGSLHSIDLPKEIYVPYALEDAKKIVPAKRKSTQEVLACLKIFGPSTLDALQFDLAYLNPGLFKIRSVKVEDCAERAYSEKIKNQVIRGAMELQNLGLVELTYEPVGSEMKTVYWLADEHKMEQAIR